MNVGNTFGTSNQIICLYLSMEISSNKTNEQNVRSYQIMNDTSMNNFIASLESTDRSDVFSLHYYSHTGDSFKKLNIMSIYQIHFYRTAIFMYKCQHHMLPPIYDNHFTLNLLCPHDTRNWTPDFARSNDPWYLSYIICFLRVQDSFI